MYFAATLVASLVVSASALATPQLHGLHRRHHHAALAKARAPASEPAPQSFVASAGIPKRQLRKRCSGRKKPSPAPDASSSASSSQTPAPAAASPPSAAPVNVAPVPDPTSSTPDPPKASPSQAHASSKDQTSSRDQTSSQAPAPTSTPSSDGSQSSSLFTGSHVGDGTFYGTGLGACGITNKDSDDIVAVSELLFDTVPGYNGGDPNSNPVCGRGITAHYQGKSVSVKVTDRCTGCDATSLDFSPHAFNQLADPSVGRLHGVSWEWD